MPDPNKLIDIDVLIERWENVLRVLTSMSKHEREKHFDMSNWGVQTSCGTAACAAGTCALDPWFRRNGFGGRFRKFAYGTALVFRGITRPSESLGNKNAKAVSAYFGASGTDHVFLCASADYPETVGNTAREIARLRHLRKNGKNAINADIHDYVSEGLFHSL